MDQKQNVLFLCTGNSARSQMAEAFLRHYGHDRFSAYSAGIEPKPINAMTIQVMEEIGFDLSGQTSKSVKEFLGRTFISWLITVCDQAEKNCPTAWPGIMHKEHWFFEDPAAFEGTTEEKVAKFRQVRDQIQAQILAWLEMQGVIVQEKLVR